jgi:hypothetical protein
MPQVKNDMLLAIKFPLKSWDEMNAEEQKHFYAMSEEDLISRWHSKEGEEIKRKIIEINLA